MTMVYYPVAPARRYELTVTYWLGTPHASPHVAVIPECEID